jgi:RNA polymerase sigma factor (sigma-70 family)
LHIGFSDHSQAITQNIGFDKMSKDFTGYIDEELWQAFKNGDGEAFSYIFEVYGKLLYNYGMKISQNRELVKDCMQDLFTELWLSRQKVSDTDSIRFYLYRCMRRKMAKQLSAHATLADLPENNLFLSQLPQDPEWIAEQQTKHQQAHLNQVLKRLTKRQREALSLRFYDEMDYEQIASIMAISTQAVYNLIFKALKTLKEHLIHQMYLLFLAMFFI